MSLSEAQFPLPGPPDRESCMAIARKLMQTRYNGADCGFAAGSVMRGEGGPGSDLDFVILYAQGDLPRPYRESFIMDGLAVEAFIQDPDLQNSYFENDIEEGVPSTLSMIAEAIVLPEETELSRAQQERARALLAAGPPALDRKDIDKRRYFITDLWEDLRHEKPGLEAELVRARLKTRLADLYLRSQGIWSGTGKGLARALEKNDPAMHNLLGRDDIDTCVKTILSPFGGPLWAGYRAEKKEG